MDKETLFDAFERYDDQKLCAYVTVYCLENEIEVDSPQWDYLISELYDQFISTDEIPYLDFDKAMAQLLV